MNEGAKTGIFWAAALVLLTVAIVFLRNQIRPIQQLAEDYAPKVITNMQVGGVQQVLLYNPVLHGVENTKM